MRTKAVAILAALTLVAAGCGSGPERVVFFKKEPCQVAPTNCLSEFPKDWVLRIHNKETRKAELYCVTRDDWDSYVVDGKFDLGDSIACTSKN